MEILKDLNWVDVLILCLACRIAYVSVQTGFVVEFMKLLAVLFAGFVAFHYYVKAGMVISRATHLMPGVTETAAFIFIWVIIFIAFKFMRDLIFMAFTVDTISALDKWGAVVVSVGRFLVTASMLLFTFLLSDIAYLERVTVSSYVQKYVLNLAPDMYRKAANGLVGKVFQGEKASSAVTAEISETGKH